MKGGAAALLTSLAIPVFNSLCVLLIPGERGPRLPEYISIPAMLERRSAGDLDWVNMLVFQLLFMLSCALLALGVRAEVQRRGKGKK